MLRLSADGWLQGVRRVDSPNCDERPAGVAIELVVVHGISLPPGAFGTAGVIGLFTNQLPVDAHPYYSTLGALRVSAHFFIGRDGQLWQFVSCHRRAWHAGVSSWHERSRCNDFSIGIEFEGTDNLPYEMEQYRVCRSLIDALCAALPLRAVAGHSDIAPRRKTDPGPCFDWGALPRLPRR